MDHVTFFLFYRLPLEIRLAIWACAITPRTVYIKGYIRNKHEPRQGEMPSLLHVCHESRAAALERYEISSDVEMGFVNFSLDIVYFQYFDCCLPYHIIFPSESEARFQFIAIDINWMYMAGAAVIEKLRRCQSLRDLTFVVNYNQRFNENSQTKLSAVLPKYEGMDDDHLHKLERDVDYESLTFVEICEQLSIMWVLGCRYFSINKERWPEISVITRSLLPLREETSC